MPQTFFGKSIKTQLTVLLFGLTAVSIGIVGFLGMRAVMGSGRDTGTITAESTRERAEELLTQTVQATAAKNSVTFQNVQRRAHDASQYVANLLANPQYFPNSHWKYDANMTKLPAGQYTNSDKELSSVFAPSTVPSTAGMKRTMELTSYMDYYVPQTFKNEANVVALYFISMEGVTRYYPNIGLAALAEPDYKPHEQEFFTVAAPENNPDKTTQWTNVYDDPAGNGLLITASHPVYNGSTFAGVIGADVTLGNIAKNIEDYSPIESSYAFLVDNTGRALALPAQGYQDILGRSAEQGESSPGLTEVSGDFAAVLKQMESGKSGFGTVDSPGSNLFVAYAPVVGTNFSLGLVAKEQVMLKVIGDVEAQVQKTTSQVLYYQMLPIAGLLLVLVWVVGFVYIRFITKPIIALTQKTNSLMQGSFAKPEEIEIPLSNNEIGTLAAAFNHMLRELSGSYKTLEHKVAEIGDAKAKDDAIINSIGDGVIITDSTGHILLINSIAARLLGLEQATGQSMDSRNLYDDAGEVIPIDQRPMRQALATGQKVNSVVLASGKGETKVALSITASPVVQNERTIGSIQIVRDVTKEKEVDRMKTEFISIASHQLRTPLSAIKWFAEMLLHGDAGKMADEQGEYVKNISASTDRMIEMVNSLLNISRLESGRILVEPVPTDLKELVEGIIDDLKAKIEKREQRFTVTVDDHIPQIKLDQRLIRQVYVNVISNALKYTPKGGSVTVTITQKNNEIVSQVSDTGYGIPKAEQVKVFNKFFRGSNIVQIETDGTGLGMYLTKSIIQSCNGRIWFESAEGKGTTFWFTIPMVGMQAKDGEVTLD